MPKIWQALRRRARRAPDPFEGLDPATVRSFKRPISFFLDPLRKPAYTAVLPVGDIGGSSMGSTEVAPAREMIQVFVTPGVQCVKCLSMMQLQDSPMLDEAGNSWLIRVRHDHH